MSQLYDLRLRIEEKIKADGLDATAIKGKIGLRSGKVLAFITAATPDDPEAIAKMRKAIEEVMNIKL